MDELLHEIAREADSGTLGHSLHHTRSRLSERREKHKLEVLALTLTLTPTRTRTLTLTR